MNIPKLALLDLEFKDEGLLDIMDEGLLLAYTDSTSSVKETPLIKEELRSKIQQRRLTMGLGEMKVEFTPPVPAELTQEEKERRDKRKEHNRESAKRSRQRKQQDLQYWLTARKEEESKNKRLKAELARLERGKQKLLYALKMRGIVVTFEANDQTKTCNNFPEEDETSGYFTRQNDFPDLVSANRETLLELDHDRISDVAVKQILGYRQPQITNTTETGSIIKIKQEFDQDTILGGPVNMGETSRQGERNLYSGISVGNKGHSKNRVVRIASDVVSKSIQETSKGIQHATENGAAVVRSGVNKTMDDNYYPDDVSHSGSLYEVMEENVSDRSSEVQTETIQNRFSNQIFKSIDFQQTGFIKPPCQVAGKPKITSARENDILDTVVNNEDVNQLCEKKRNLDLMASKREYRQEHSMDNVSGNIVNSKDILRQPNQIRFLQNKSYKLQTATDVANNEESLQKFVLLNNFRKARLLTSNAGIIQQPVTTTDNVSSQNQPNPVYGNVLTSHQLSSSSSFAALDENFSSLPCVEMEQEQLNSLTSDVGCANNGHTDQQNHQNTNSSGDQCVPYGPGSTYGESPEAILNEPHSMYGNTDQSREGSPRTVFKLKDTSVLGDISVEHINNIGDEQCDVSNKPVFIGIHASQQTTNLIATGHKPFQGGNSFKDSDVEERRGHQPDIDVKTKDLADLCFGLEETWGKLPCAIGINAILNNR